jgi:hypothetical protein
VDANTVIAICSVVIAVASLGASAYVAWLRGIIAATLAGQPFLDTDHQRFLPSVDRYNKSEHSGFAELIRGQLRLEIQYESIFGQRTTVIYPQREWASSPPAQDRP